MPEEIVTAQATPPVVPQPTPAAEVSSPKKSNLKLPLLAIAALIVVAIIGVGAYLMMSKTAKPTGQTAAGTSSNGKIQIKFAVHWSDATQLKGIYKNGKLVTKGFQQYLDEYNKAHPNIEVVAQTIPYEKYANEFQALSDANMPPDIYQVYSNWAVSYVDNGILDVPPADVVADVTKNSISTAGVTIKNQIWGIPTEVDDYSMLYNKDLFKAAGITTPPATWAEFVADAARLTKKDAKGTITQYGAAFLIDNDWEVVDPFLSLLFSNGGQYLSADNKKALFNGPEGIAALNAELQLFKQGSTDINGNFFDFGKGKVGMVIAPPWNKTAFETDFGAKAASIIGVAPFPYMVKPATLQYGWFTGVSAKSQHKTEAWDFLRWYSSAAEDAATGTTPLGTLMAENIGAIPGRTADFNDHKAILGDFYTKTYIDQMKTSVSEPNVAQASDIKKILMTNIQAAWSGQKTAQQALDAAATDVNKILAQNK